MYFVMGRPSSKLTSRHQEVYTCKYLDSGIYLIADYRLSSPEINEYVPKILSDGYTIFQTVTSRY